MNKKMIPNAFTANRSIMMNYMNNDSPEIIAAVDIP